MLARSVNLDENGDGNGKKQKWGSRQEKRPDVAV